MNNQAKISKYILRKIKEYKSESLNISMISPEPLKEFKKWYKKAESHNRYEANKMLISTISNNKPHSRYVLMKSFEKNITFFTNYNSNKSKDLEKNNNISAAFHWPDINIQIRIEGKTKKTTKKENEEYFKTRDKKSRFASIISDQSKKITEEEFLEFKSKLEEFDEEEEYPCPENWGGFLIVPCYFEFWAGKESRAHERIVYELVDGKWETYRLLP